MDDLLFFFLKKNVYNSSPIYAMTLEKENAVQDWRVLMGPTDSAKAKVVEQNR